ncbi:MAG: M48 family metalloprotease [Halioglobus sp.]
MGQYLIRASLCAVVLLAIGCSVNPVTGENQLSLISTSQELAIGEKNYLPSQQSQGGQYTVDASLQAYIAEVGQTLAAVSDAPDLPYEFVVLNNSVPNAWAMPGGKIAINRGLLSLLNDESELAAVLGHEVVHAAARHGASQMTRSTFIGLGSQIAAIAAQTQGYGQLGGLAAQLGGGAWLAKYGRDDELESDYYGMKYMSLAGYSPEGAVRLQELFVSLKNGKQQDFLSQLFASHPPSQERVKANIERAATLPRGQTFRERYQRKTAQLRKDKGAYEAQKKAMSALKEKKGKQALKFLDEAIAIQPNDGQFWELRGHAWEMLGNHSNAEKAFSTAIRKSPDYFAPKLYRGLLRYENGNKAGAREDLKASYAILPTQVAAFHLGELAMASGDQQSALSFYRSASGGKGEVSGQARARLVTLELAQMPDKYILSKTYIDRNGMLRVAVKNNSGIAVSGVRVQLAQLTSRTSMGRAQNLRGSYNLKPGQEISIKTGVGPFESAAAANNYRARVAAARPAKTAKRI